MTNWTSQQYCSFVQYHFRVLLAASSPYLFALLAGAVVGLTAWHWGNTPYLAIAFPVLFPCMRGRAGVYAYALGYHACTVYGLMGFASAWFNDSILMGAVSWFMLSTLAAVVWPIFVSGDKSKSAVSTAITTSLAMVAGLLPPFALVLDGHPLPAWGYVLEGWGFLGVAVAIVATGVCAGLVRHTRGLLIQRHLLILGLTLCGAAGATSPIPEFKPPRGVVGVDTYFGKPPAGDMEQVERYGEVRRTIKQVTEEGQIGEVAQVLVFPENTMNLDDPALDFMVSSEVVAPLKWAGKSAVVGKIGRGKDGHYRNQAVLISPGNPSVVVDQRQPAMLSMWRPWHSEHFSSDWFRDTRIDLSNGEVARVIICYEEYIPAIFLIDELKGGHTMAVVMTSNWSATDPRLPEVQRLHSLGMLKMFDRAAVRSVNYPGSFNPSGQSF
nr:hypothetical protein [Comamonas testosteroni]